MDELLPFQAQSLRINANYLGSMLKNLNQRDKMLKTRAKYSKKLHHISAYLSQVVNIGHTELLRSEQPYSDF